MAGTRITDDASGTLSAMAHSAVNVNGSTLVLAANAARQYGLFINDSDTTIWLRLDGSAAITDLGVMLLANGGAFEMSKKYGNLYTGAVYANHGGGAVDKVLCVTEGR